MRNLLLAMTVALGGCVSAQSQQQLSALQQQCAAGNQDACTASGYKAQANQQEQQTNAAAAAGVGAAVLGTAIIAAPLIYGQPGYRSSYRSSPVIVVPRRY